MNDHSAPCLRSANSQPPKSRILLPVLLFFLSLRRIDHHSRSGEKKQDGENDLQSEYRLILRRHLAGPEKLPKDEQHDYRTASMTLVLAISPGGGGLVILCRQSMRARNCDGVKPYQSSSLPLNAFR
nr:hypothetical protein CFP56_04540 [Quercus suber]